MKDCLKCTDVCCLHADISLNIFDAAKLLEYFPNYELVYLTEDSKSNFDIFVNIQKIFEIRDKVPRIRLPGRCNFLNNHNLCDIHSLKIEKDRPLGTLLTILGVPLDIKPMICRQHPIFYDPKENCLREYENCELQKNSPSRVIENHRAELEETLFVCRSYYAIYEKLEQGILIWDMIQMLMKGKNFFT